MFLLLLVLPTIICTFSARKYFSLTDSTIAFVVVAADIGGVSATWHSSWP